MPIKQVSVFLDNRPGALSEVITHIDKFQIKIFALSIADAGEFGLMRMITEDPERAAKKLEDADLILAKSKKNTEVIVFLITENAKVSQIAKMLGDEKLNIEYAYSSAVLIDGKLAVVMRVNDLNKTEIILKENNIPTLSLEEIKKSFE
ncbi:hypothetical protein ACFLRN_05090 [Thermoproteota archaeon]